MRLPPSCLKVYAVLLTESPALVVTLKSSNDALPDKGKSTMSAGTSEATGLVQLNVYWVTVARLSMADTALPASDVKVSSVLSVSGVMTWFKLFAVVESVA